MNKAILKYYGDVTRYNAAFSVILAFITLDPMKGLISLATGGTLFSLYCYKQFQHNQYYFYYNVGLTKTKLITFTWLLNLLIASLLAIFFLVLS